MLLQQIVDPLTIFLKSNEITDYCPNGLQIANTGMIHKICTAVTASLDAIEATAACGANLLLVHHGYFWKGEASPIVDMKYQRIAALIKHNIALLAYHLPLDIHPDLGNNAEIARLLGLKITEWARPDGRIPLVALAEYAHPQHLDQVSAQCETIFQRTPLVIAGGPHPIKRIAWCSGGAQDYILDAKKMGSSAKSVGARRFSQFPELVI